MLNTKQMNNFTCR